MHISNMGEWWHTHIHTHTRTHTQSQDTHWHTHMQLRWKSVECLLCVSPILASSPRESQEQWAASNAAPGDQVPSPVLVRDQDQWASVSSACFCCCGVLWGGTRVNTGLTCKLHTERPGNKPRHVGPCGTWTHNLLAVRQQCYALSHRAPYTIWEDCKGCTSEHISS